MQYSKSKLWKVTNRLVLAGRLVCVYGDMVCDRKIHIRI